jgi:hypothetical protein
MVCVGSCSMQESVGGVRISNGQRIVFVSGGIAPHLARQGQPTDDVGVAGTEPSSWVSKR